MSILSSQSTTTTTYRHTYSGKRIHQRYTVKSYRGRDHRSPDRKTEFFDEKGEKIVIDGYKELHAKIKAIQDDYIMEHQTDLYDTF